MVPDWLLHIPLNQTCRAARKHGVRWEVLASMVYQESRGDPKALRFEPTYRYLYRPRDYYEMHGISLKTEETCQQFSVGLMQLMFAVMREMGFKGSFVDAFCPELNLDYGAKKLKELIDRFGTEENAVSSYNWGHVARTPGGFYENQKRYVDPIYKRVRELEALN